MSTSGEGEVETGAAARSNASVSDGMLMLPAPKLLQTGVLALSGGYTGITGPRADGGNVVSPETGD